MRKVSLLYLLAVVLLFCLAYAPLAFSFETGGHIIIGADGNWTTDLTLYNAGPIMLTQKVGRLTFTNGSFDPIIFEPTVTLQPGETRVILRADRNFDNGKNYALAVEQGIRAWVFLSFGPAKFEMTNIAAGIDEASERLDFRGIRSGGGGEGAVGTFMLVMNTSSSDVSLSFRVTGPKKVGDDYPFGDEHFVAPPGVSIYPLRSVVPEGAWVRMCVVDCSIALHGAMPIIYGVADVGPPDGGTQSLRYPD